MLNLDCYANSKKIVTPSCCQVQNEKAKAMLSGMQSRVGPVFTAQVSICEAHCPQSAQPGLWARC